MRHSGFRRWMWLGGAASALLLSVGCGRLAQSGGESANEPPQNFFGNLARSEDGVDLSRYHAPKDRGYNGTIVDLGSSIDPRTPELEGVAGRSLMTDITGYMGRPDVAQGYLEPPTSLGIGGSGFDNSLGETSEAGWQQRQRTGPIATDQGPSDIQRPTSTGSGAE